MATAMNNQPGPQPTLARPDNDIDDSKYDVAPGTSETTRLRHDEEITNLSDPKSPGVATVQIQDPPVTETRGYEIVKVEEKHGAFHSAIPVMPMGFAVVFCLINMFLPGIGEFVNLFY